jgi:predicted SnoaL-like aldol condensation-catalyzing enzyme
MQHRSIDEVKFLLGERDFVFIVAVGTVEGEPCVYVDLYRVEDEKIAEHWGFPEKIPPSMLASFAAAGHPSGRKL